MRCFWRKCGHHLWKTPLKIMLNNQNGKHIQDNKLLTAQNREKCGLKNWNRYLKINTWKIKTQEIQLKKSYVNQFAISIWNHSNDASETNEQNTLNYSAIDKSNDLLSSEPKRGFEPPLNFSTSEKTFNVEQVKNFPFSFVSILAGNRSIFLMQLLKLRCSGFWLRKDLKAFLVVFVIYWWNGGAWYFFLMDFGFL